MTKLILGTVSEYTGIGGDKKKIPVYKDGETEKAYRELKTINILDEAGEVVSSVWYLGNSDRRDLYATPEAGLAAFQRKRDEYEAQKAKWATEVASATLGNEEDEEDEEDAG